MFREVKAMRVTLGSWSLDIFDHGTTIFLEIQTRIGYTGASMNTTIDTVKEYWDRRPCNIRHSPEPVGTKAYFDQVEARKYFVEYHIPGFADFKKWSGKKVLEIGCGIGTDSIN